MILVRELGEMANEQTGHRRERLVPAVDRQLEEQRGRQAAGPR